MKTTLKNLKKLIGEAVSDIDRVVLEDLFSRAAQGDKDSWLVFLDKLEESWPNARHRMELQENEGVVTRLSIIRDALGGNGVINNTDHFMSFRPRTGVAFSFDNSLRVVAVADTGKHEGLNREKLIGFHEADVMLIENGWTVVRLFPTRTFLVNNDEFLVAREIRHNIRAGTEGRWLIDSGDMDDEIASYEDESCPTLVKELFEAYVLEAQETWKSLDNMFSLPSKTPRGKKKKLTYTRA